MDRNIYLIGPRACGKTTLGKALAKRLGRPFVDTDHVLVMHMGMPVARFVADHGWDRFRDVEEEVLRVVAEKAGQVVACGGGIVLRPGNRERLAGGIVFYLKASAQTLADRLRLDPNEGQRPSLTGRPIEEEVRDVLAEREPLYAACAHAVIPADQSPESALDQMVRDLAPGSHGARPAGGGRI